MSKLFSNNNVNSGRQIEWDYAKVFAIITMIFVHFLAFCTFSKIDYGYIEEYLFILTQSSAYFHVCNGNWNGLYQTRFRKNLL